MFNKSGQGLSLNVIIIAALALIVLVVLAAIFIQQTGVFTGRLGQEGNTDLASLKATYGQCHPSRIAEGKFVTAFNRAEIPEDRELARDTLREIIRNCGVIDSSVACEASSDCSWQ